LAINIKHTGIRRGDFSRLLNNLFGGTLVLHIVSSDHLKKKFDEIWTSVYLKSNYELEPFNGDEVIRYLVKHREQELYVASIEVVFNYAKNGQDYDYLFAFSSLGEIKSDLEHTVIIQKVAILQEYQNQGYLEVLLYTLSLLKEEHNLRFGIAFIEPNLYLALKMLYRISVKRCGKKFLYKGDEVIPVLIDIRDTYNRTDELSWLKNLKNNLKKPNLQDSLSQIE
jgi:hypothetical protein